MTGGDGDRDRIAVLDGFRALAILLVVAYHYFARWAPPTHPESLYPYGGWLAEVPLVEYGYLGVELFFIISGFVISLTLLRCTGWTDFAWKRFARLFPTMLLCTVVTFAVVATLATPPFDVAWRDFLPGLTFTQPSLWEGAIGAPFGDIDGVYWSLQVEVKFYVWAGLLFFAVGAPARFGLRFLVFLNVVVAAQIVAWASGMDALSSLLEFAVVPDHLPWFAAGVGFSLLFRDRRDVVGLVLVVQSFVLVLANSGVRGAMPVAGWVATVAFFWALFVLLLVRSRWLAPFAVRPMVVVGAASYSLYLLHQAIGVSFITLFERSTGLDGRPTALVALGVAVGLTAASVLVYRRWELPAKRRLLMWRSQRSVASAPAVR